MKKPLIQTINIQSAILSQIDKFFQIRTVVIKLYEKFISQQHMKSQFEQQIQCSIKQDKQQIKQNIKHSILSQIINPQHKYYQRVELKEKYENFISELVINLQNILKKAEHNFYSNRKTQVQYIKNIVQSLDIIKSRISQFISHLKIKINQQFQLFNLIQHTSKLSKRIIFQTNHLKDKSQKNYKLHFILPVQPKTTKYKNIQQQQFKYSRPQTAAKSYTLTNTTRPSSTTKQNRQAKIKLFNLQNSIWNTRPSSIYENLIGTDIQKYQRNNKKIKMITARQKSATIRNTIRIKQTLQNQQYFYKLSQKQIQIAPNSTKKIIQNNNIQNGQSVTNSKGVEDLVIIKSEQLKHTVKKQNSLNNLQQRFKFVKQDKTKRQQYLGKEKHRNGIKNPSYLNQMIPLWRKTYQKKHIISQDRKTSSNSLKKHNKRLNQTSTIFPDKKLQNMKLQNLKKKLKYPKKAMRKIKNNKKHSKMSDLQQIQQIKQIQATYLQKKRKTLLIKHFQEKPVNLSTNPQLKQINPTSTQKLKKQFEDFVISDEDEIAKRRKQSLFFINNQKQIEKFQINKILANIQFTEINKIRQQFLQARWQNRIPWGKNQQNSAFFIQQGFLSQRENSKFQNYIKNQLLNGKITKQQIMLQNETEQKLDQKLNQLQRYYTFVSQDQWIKKRRFKELQEEDIQFKQLGLQFIQKQII